MTRPTLKSGTARSEHGMVLVTALILLAVLTLVAVVAMRTTTLDLRMANNAMLKARAFEGSEGARVQVPDVLDKHVFYRGWPTTAVGMAAAAGFNIPSELDISIIEAKGNLYEEPRGADMGDYAAGKQDMEYRSDGDGSGAVSDNSPTPQDISADQFITNLGSIKAAGSATAMVSAYEGFGKATAAGGSYSLFDLRSRGHAASRTEGLTGSDVRVVVRN